MIIDCHFWNNFDCQLQQEITNLTKKPTEEWWRKDHVDKEGYCRCSQLWYLLKNVQMAWKEDQQQEQQEEEEEMNLDVDI